MWRVILFCILILPFAARAAADEAYSPQWLALMHYRRQWLGGYRSSIEEKAFFVSDKGQNNPQAELQAAIALFEKGENTEVICSFPARYKFLHSRGLVKNKFPFCKDFEQFKADLRASGVTLLFTDAYMNNPSSLFGHTLLRIDTSLEQTQMAAHGANYGAYVPPAENNLLYPLYGMTGVYSGGWTVKPYYNILNTYNNLENRDIWELNLNFSPEELDTLIAHLWEVQHGPTPYYFFSKNCSYMLMELLDAVRPELQLADEFGIYTIPLDTFKAVYRREGLVKGINYRPSRQQQIIHQVGQMNKTQKKAFYAAIRNDDYSLHGVAEEEQADVLESVYQYVQYQYVKKDLVLEEYRRRSFKGLFKRNGLKKRAKFSTKPQGESPLESHESMRISIGAGSRNGKNFEEISWQPAYHSLTDNNYGLLPGAEIYLFNFKIRHYDATNQTVLQQLNLANVRSLAPVNRMFRPLSFSLKADIAREMRPDDEKEGYLFNLKAGGGAAFEVVKGINLYALGNVYGSYGALLRRNQYAGLGALGGVFVDFSHFKMLAEAEKIWATSWFGNKIGYRIEANVPFFVNWGIAAEYKYDDNQKGKNLEEVTVSLRHYF